MKLGLLITDHKRTSLKDREKLYFTPATKEVFIHKGVDFSGLKELVMVSTCNRTEIYFSSEDLDASVTLIKQYLAKLHEIETDFIDHCFEVKFGEEVIYHLYRVASGLESMVLGENEILAQLKKAYQFSLERALTSSLFNKLFQAAIATGKAVRDTTKINQGAHSVTSIAIDYAMTEFPDDFLDKKILIIGAGDMAIRSLKKLYGLKHPKLFMTNRTKRKVTDLSKQYAVKYVPYIQLSRTLLDFDIIIVAIQARRYIIGPRQFAPSSNAFIIDLGVPRNVDPMSNQVNNKEIITIDHLQRISEQNLESRKDEVWRAEACIANKISEFLQWYQYKEAQCLNAFA